MVPTISRLLKKAKKTAKKAKKTQKKSKTDETVLDRYVDMRANNWHGKKERKKLKIMIDALTIKPNDNSKKAKKKSTAKKAKAARKTTVKKVTGPKKASREKI